MFLFYRFLMKILFHRSWLGSSQLSDALECINILKVIKPELVIVDHYAIDYVWEKEINHFTKRIMVIDDLMDRRHECSLLLDQTLGRSIEDYSNLVSNECIMMLGSSYALIRSEFLAWRESSIRRRLNESSINIKHLLINMGGVDKDNITTMVLDSLSNINLPSSLNITVVMGLTSPNINKVKESINKSRFLIDLKIGVKNFEEIISKSDLAIGAAGSSSWERCFLGLPSILIVLADNQNSVASSLSSKGAAKVINNIDDIEKSLPLILSDLINTPKEILKMSKSASSIIDGKGIDRVVKKIHAYK